MTPKSGSTVTILPVDKHWFKRASLIRKRNSHCSFVFHHRLVAAGCYLTQEADYDLRQEPSGSSFLELGGPYDSRQEPSNSCVLRKEPTGPYDSRPEPHGSGVLKKERGGRYDLRQELLGNSSSEPGGRSLPLLILHGGRVDHHQLVLRLFA